MNIRILAHSAGNSTDIEFPIRSIRTNNIGGYTVTLIAPHGRIYGRGRTKWLAIEAAQRVATNWVGAAVERGQLS